MLNENPLFLTW